MKIKKILAVVLAAMLLFAFVGNAFAATVDTTATWKRLAVTSKTTNAVSNNTRIVQEICYAFSLACANELKYMKNGVPVWIDASFGDGTAKAVKLFQKNRNLTQDGMVGPNTWGAMCNQLIATVISSGSNNVVANYTIDPSKSTNSTSWQTINTFQYVADSSSTVLRFKVGSSSSWFTMIFG